MKYIKEYIKSDFESISSFKVNDTLNDLVWNNFKLDDTIKEDLLSIVDKYWSELELDLNIDDIYFTGSLVNYNYSKYSDFDIHIITDFSKTKDPELTQKYCDQFEKNWKSKHHITIKGFDVELYVQNGIGDTITSAAIYSLKKDKWIIKPEKFNVEPDLELVKTKSKKIMKQIDSLIDDYKSNKDLKELDKEAKTLWTKLKNGRKSGLESGGEMSVENLVFKFLRRNGYSGKLIDLRSKIFDKIYTID